MNNTFHSISTYVPELKGLFTVYNSGIVYGKYKDWKATNQFTALCSSPDTRLYKSPFVDELISDSYGTFK